MSFFSPITIRVKELLQNYEKCCCQTNVVLKKLCQHSPSSFLFESEVDNKGLNLLFSLYQAFFLYFIMLKFKFSVKIIGGNTDLYAYSYYLCWVIKKEKI